MQTNIKEYDESFDLTQALQKKGTKEYGFIHLAQRANGSWVNIPEYVSVFSGTYIGDETYYAVYEVSQDSIDVIVKSVKGTLLEQFSITDAQ